MYEKESCNCDTADTHPSGIPEARWYQAADPTSSTLQQQQQLLSARRPLRPCHIKHPLRSHFRLEVALESVAPPRGRCALSAGDAETTQDRNGKSHC